MKKTRMRMSFYWGEMRDGKMLVSTSVRVRTWLCIEIRKVFCT